MVPAGTVEVETLQTTVKTIEKSKGTQTERAWGEESVENTALC
jgi:hypothetical protein